MPTSPTTDFHFWTMARQDGRDYAARHDSATLADAMAAHRQAQGWLWLEGRDDGYVSPLWQDGKQVRPAVYQRPPKSTHRDDWMKAASRKDWL